MFKSRHPLPRHRLEGRRIRKEKGKERRIREEKREGENNREGKGGREGGGGGGGGGGEGRREKGRQKWGGRRFYVTFIPPSTDAGKVIKVVFTSHGSNVFPVIVEEIAFDDDNNIEKMAIHPISGDRFLFVNTHSKIYKFPLAWCSRHKSCM